MLYLVYNQGSEIMFGKKNKQVNNTPPQVNAGDNTYSDYLYHLNNK